MNPASNKNLSEARALLESYNHAQALPLYEKLVRQFPLKAWMWLEYGGAAVGAGRLDLAEQAWRKVCELEPHNSDYMVKIGHQYRGLRDPAKARAWYGKAAAANAKDVNPHLAVATLLERDHRFAEAREAVDSCLKIDPRDDQARFFGAVLDRRENKIEDAERRLRDLIASTPQHQYVQYACRYELAEVLDRTGRFDEAMQLLGEAKSFVRRLGDIRGMLHEYDQGADRSRRLTRELPKDILRAWAKDFPEKARAALPKMAFLGGHPRSGTTLLEQVLGAHPGIAAVDEARAFPVVVCSLFDASPQINAARLNIIRRRYLESIRQSWAGNLDGMLLLDKNPLPTIELRIWLRVFPELRVIMALRDPRDVIVSCYFQNIPLNPYNANFLSLERTAKRYGDLMDVWLAVRQWEGLAAIETRYEDTVAGLGKEGRRVTEFIGLDWNPTQERYHEKSSRKEAYSSIYFEARQPVYARSVARWRSYEKHLAPVLPVLEPYCRALGYA